jgi:hypothetical protein
MSKETSGGLDLFGLIGVVGATYLSWMKWHSVPWALLHAGLSWFYILYYYIRY